MNELEGGLHICPRLSGGASNVHFSLLIGHHLPRQNEECVDGMSAIEDRPKTGFGTVKPF